MKPTEYFEIYDDLRCNGWPAREAQIMAKALARVNRGEEDD